MSASDQAAKKKMYTFTKLLLGPPGRLKDEYGGGMVGVGVGVPQIEAGPAQTVQHPPQEPGFPQLMSGNFCRYWFS